MKILKKNKLLNNDEIESQKNSNIAEDKNKKDYREKLKNTYGLRRYKIQEVIKPGQVVLIQVQKKKNEDKKELR